MSYQIMRDETNNIDSVDDIEQYLTRHTVYAAINVVLILYIM